MNTRHHDSVSTDDCSPSLVHKLGRAGHLMHRYFHESARSHGGIGDASRGQGRILTLLSSKPETSQRELSYILDMRQQSLSELLAKLEHKAYITRERSAEDGRVMMVRLTEEGRAAALNLTESMAPDDPLACLNEEERESFEASINKIIKSLEEKLLAMDVDPYSRPIPPHGKHRHHGPHRHPDSCGHHGPHRHPDPHGCHSSHGHPDPHGCHGPHGRE